MFYCPRPQRRVLLSCVAAQVRQKGDGTQHYKIVIASRARQEIFVLLTILHQNPTQARGVKNETHICGYVSKK